MNENDKLHILGIAPYESLQNLMLSLAEKRDDMVIDVVTADLESGITEVNNHSLAHYDAIISRGATAKIVRSHSSIPVIEIPLSFYDILRAIKLTENYTGQLAIVGFSDLTTNAKLLCELMQYDMQIFTVTQKEDISGILQQLMQKSCTFILCDASTEKIAKKFGLTPILITSGIESVQTAFDSAIHICRGVAKLQSENELLRDALGNQNNSIYIFNSSRELFFSSSNFQNENSFIESYLLELTYSLEKKFFQKSFHLIHDILYSVSLHMTVTDQDSYYAFTVESNPVPQSGSKYGMHYCDELEMQNAYFNSIYSLTNSFTTIRDQVNSISLSTQPVMILGEKGTGKDIIAAKLYIESKLASKPFIWINCELINQKYWNYLINNYNSPLCDNDNTIFISNIQALSSLQRKQLLSLALDTNLSKRNRLFFSCSKTIANSSEDAARDYIDYFPCITLNLPPLRELVNDIPSTVNLYLNKLNIEHSKEIIGVESAAMDTLTSYSWPQNYMQLKRVLSELVLLTDTSYIRNELVTQLIEKEKIQFPESEASNSNQYDTDLTLDEINRTIIQQAIKKCNGNQSKAAKQLGISRTTIWRYLN